MGDPCVLRWTAEDRDGGRRAVVAGGHDLATAPGRVMTGAGRSVALLFPGQGAQHRAMATGLYGWAPAFTEAVDETLELFGDPGLRADWLAGKDLDEADRAQPLLFALGYGLGRLVLSLGVRPAVLLGHSAGELVAATLAGVFDLADAVRIQRDRVARMDAAPAGGMLAVAAAEERVLPHLRDGVAVAAVNGPWQTLVSGSERGLRSVEESLRAAGLTVRRAGALRAFHNPAMRPSADGSLAAYAGVTLRAPRIPMYSGYTAAPLTPREAVRPEFWARQLAEPVRFRPALDALLSEDAGGLLLVEAGPGQGLATLARGHPAVVAGRCAVTALLPRPRGDDRLALLTGLARIWVEGQQVDWPALQGVPA